MSRTKRGLALFELLATGDEQGGKPSLMPGRRSQRGHAPRDDTARTASEETAAPALAESSAAGPARAPGGRAPLVELDGDRIRLSLTSLAAAGVVFACAVLTVGVFELGRWRGDQTGFRRGYGAGRASYAADAANEIELARSRPPATNLVSSLLRESQAHVPEDDTADRGTAGDSRQVRWIRDYTYIVAQEFSAGRVEHARNTQDYLRRNGVATELVEYPSGAMQLITTQGFRLSDSAQRKIAEELRAKIRELGTEYYAAGGGYKLEGYFKTLKDDTW